MQPIEDYVKVIKNALVTHSSRRSGRYDYDNFGFDAEEVSAQLETLIEKARYYIKYQNIEVSIIIAQKMIETIPDKWNQNLDYEDDVQVNYEEAIDILEGLFKDELLSAKQKELLFDWYEKEIKDNKHEYVGLNTSLDVLEDYFLLGVKDGFLRTLQIIDQQIRASSVYTQKGLIESKIHILYEFNHSVEADKMITDFLHIPRIRKIRLQQMLEKKSINQQST